MLFSIVKITLFLQSDDSKVPELLLSADKQGIKNHAYHFSVICVVSLC